MTAIATQPTPPLAPSAPVADKPRSASRHLLVADEAFQAALKIRADVQKKIRMRPDMAIVIAAMLQRAAELPDIADSVARYGLARCAPANEARNE